MTSKLIYLPVALGVIALAKPAHADITIEGLNGLEAVKLFGDMRMRFERTEGDTIDSTSRARLRARFGIKYAATDNWSAQMRFRTTSSQHDSTHQTFGITDTSDNDDFGRPRLYEVHRD